MGKDELYITVPFMFRCPISLDVMKSPVSLCTGVTYDRSSIQHWLDSGHDTCPATMQVLSTKDVVPNLTLHRLISLWSHSSSSSAPPSTAVDPPEMSEKLVRGWIESVDCTESLVKIVEFVSCCEENRRFLVSFDCFVEAVVGVLRRESAEIRVLELVIRVLDSVLTENGVKEKLNTLILKSDQNSLSSFISVLRDGNPSSKTESVRVLESISSLDSESKRFLAETEQLPPVLLRVLKTENDNTLNDAVLSFLISLSKIRSVKVQLVQLGLVQVLTDTLSNQNAAVSVVEKSLKLLSVISTCAEGRLAVSEDGMCVGEMVGRLMKVSKTATEDVVFVLWSMCCSFRDGRVQEKIVRNNGVMKVLLVMQSVGEGSVRRMCRDLVKVLRVSSSGGGGGLGLGKYETKSTHIMPC